MLFSPICRFDLQRRITDLWRHWIGKSMFDLYDAINHQFRRSALYKIELAYSTDWVAKIRSRLYITILEISNKIFENIYITVFRSNAPSSDYFFESMILLKNELCWEWTDVLYFVTNQRQNRVELNQVLTDRILKWNSIDAQIFKRANETFWQKYNQLENVEIMRSEFQEQLGKFFRINSPLILFFR